MAESNNPQTVARTPNPACHACILQARHTKFCWAEFHPYAGHGYTKERGWSHPDLEPKQ